MHPNSLANLKSVQKGQVLNPAGRPKGSKSRLQETFLKALADDFEQHGEQAIAVVRENDTPTYLRIVASLVPKEIDITKQNTNIWDELSDTELAAVLTGLRALIADPAGRGSNLIEAKPAEITEGEPLPVH